MTNEPQYRCPVDDCSYTNKHGSVIAHAVGKKDEKHAGLAYQEVRKVLDQAGPIDGSTDAPKDPEPDAEPTESDEMSVFDEPTPDRQGDTTDKDQAKVHAGASWPLKQGQHVTGADGNTYQTEAGDRVVSSPDGDAIPLTAGQTLETADGRYIQTEQGDHLA
jgi:hypothetical protein